MCHPPVPPPAPLHQDPQVQLSSFAFLNPPLPLGIQISPPHQLHPLHSFRVRKTECIRVQKVRDTERCERCMAASTPPIRPARFPPPGPPHLLTTLRTIPGRVLEIYVPQKRPTFVLQNPCFQRFLVFGPTYTIKCEKRYQQEELLSRPGSL